MPLNLDFVGLNTLVREDIDTNTNTIGRKVVKALTFTDDGSDHNALNATSTFPSSGTTGGFSFSFWAKLDGSDTSNRDIFNSRNDTGIVMSVRFEGNYFKAFIYDNSSVGKLFRFDVPVGNVVDNYVHFVFSWDGSFEGSSAVLYINGVENVTNYNDITPSSGNIRKQIGTFAIGGSVNDGGSSSSGLDGSLFDLCLFNKKLNNTEAAELYSDGLVNDPRNTSFSSNIFFYIKLGEEEELSSFVHDETIPLNTTLRSEIGNVSFTATVPLALQVVNKNIEARNRQILTIPYINHFAALNTNRNGLYGHPTFKQIRVSENPITRYHNKNNILSYIPDTTKERRVVQNEQIVSIHHDKYADIKSTIEAPVTSNKKPISLVVNAKIEDEYETIEEKIELSTTFLNNIQYFKNNELNILNNLAQDTTKNYEDLKNLYLKPNTQDSAIDSVESLKLEQTIFPTDLYTSRYHTRQRPNYIYEPWRSLRTNRQQKQIDNNFGHTIPSQSAWPLDSVEGFQNQTLVGTLGSFRIYGPSVLTASTNVAVASGIHFPQEAAAGGTARGMFYYTRDFATETTDLGYTLTTEDWSEVTWSSNYLRFFGASNGDHLIRGCRSFWEQLQTMFTIQTTALGPQYESAVFEENISTRKGIYFSDLGNIYSQGEIGNHSRFVQIDGIRLNAPAPSPATKTYRQHWHSSSVNCGITFWYALTNHPADHYDTLLFDISASLDGDEIIGNDSTDISALNRHIYFTTSSVNKLADSGWTSLGRPMMVVRLGTKWFKNDGSVHYGNTPEEGAVEFIFDDIWGANNPLGTNLSNRLKPQVSRQSHFYISLSQSMKHDDLSESVSSAMSGNCILAINGEFMSASFINDQWGFLNKKNNVPTAHQEYTASMWTANCTASAPTNVFWFQAGSEDDTTYLNEVMMSDIAIFSGSFNNALDHASQLNPKVMNFCGGVSGSQSIVTEVAKATGIRFLNYIYAKSLGTLTELSGPFLWYDFEKTNTGEEFGYSDSSFGLAVYSASHNITYYDYSASSDHPISGYVEPIEEGLRLDSGSYADWTITPGTNFNTYAMDPTSATGSSFFAVPLELQKAGVSKVFTSPSEASPPIGGSTGRNSFKGAGILQNSYSQFSRNLNLAAANSIDTQLSAACYYSRRHTLTASATVVNPFFLNLSSSTIYPLIEQHLYLGTAKWEAPEQAGRFNSEGNFVLSPKEPFYDSYEKYTEEFRGLGKSHSIVPEFRIDNHIENYLSKGPTEERLNLFEITGGLSTLLDSSDSEFYKVYSNTDFLEHFDVVKNEHKDMFDPYKITLSCKAIKKFLPHKGFYPCERTTHLAEQFYSSYKNNIFATSSQGVIIKGTNYPFQYLMNPLFGPGVLFNTIKSGIACDYPVWTSDIVPSTNDNLNYFINSSFDTRLPFESLIEPEKYLSNIKLVSNEPDPNGNTKAEVTWDGQGDELYKMKMNNFLSEVGNFFLKNENYTTMTSLPQGDPNFGNADGDLVYSMRLKMYRTVTGSKGTQTSHTDVTFGVPQDSGSIGEAFTMYSRPSAFGPPTVFSASTMQPKVWNSFKKHNSPDFLYSTSSTYTAVTGNLANNGYNYPFTPPYYHGEAWADITFVPPDGTKKYSLSEIINNSSVEFCRFFVSGSGLAPERQIFSSGTFATNEQAMQIASSMNIFSRGILKTDIEQIDNITIDTQQENKYRWIIQSKFETPVLNFNHHSHDTITMPNIATSSVPIGMWHQYGRIPQETNEGIFVQIEDVPKNWIEGALQADSDTTGSLLNLCGFSSDPIRIGEIKETKVIEEAVVAVPFITRNNKNSFFTLNKEDVKAAISGKTEVVGKTVSDLVDKLRKYVFPPSFDFVAYKDVKPLIMYVFEFSHTLSKQDLSDIWQNLPPSIGTTHEVATAEISHELFSQEFFGEGAQLDQTQKMQKFTPVSTIPSDIRWMVFKVKKRASSNYFEKMFERNDSGTGTLSESIVSSTTGKQQKISYNWPYDFFSLVELIKLDASIEFGHVDEEKSITLDKTVLKPVKL